jgi:hypothetical protein
MSWICAAAAEARLPAVGQHFFEEMTVILFLRRCVNPARISRGILLRELADAFEVSRVCNDAREFLELIELIQLSPQFFLYRH